MIWHLKKSKYEPWLVLTSFIASLHQTCLWDVPQEALLNFRWQWVIENTRGSCFGPRFATVGKHSSIMLFRTWYNWTSLHCYSNECINCEFWSSHNNKTHRNQAIHVDVILLSAFYMKSSRKRVGQNVSKAIRWITLLMHSNRLSLHAFYISNSVIL